MKVIDLPPKAEEMVEMSRVYLTFPKVIYRVTTVTNVTKCVILFARYSLEPW